MLLCRFAFYSRRAGQVSDRDEEDRELLRILEAGLRNNPRHGLTGVLLVDGPHFVQVLEGPRRLLYPTLKRIERNPHHDDLVLTGYSEIDGRMFDDWSVFVRTPPARLAGTPWIPNPELATHGQVIETARRVRCGKAGVRQIYAADLRPGAGAQ
ncbi:BLUF domain-containing protein [Maricaulis sp.]|uniref:BLUF domain-containing protein n=1 Tax=Maricaulis sp. TaxID=1486257 RepID=UPI003A92B40B